MKMFRTLMVVMLIVGSVAGPTVNAGSIWARGTRRTRSLFTDDTARDVGDILTIVIDEQSTIENETTRTMNKKTSRSGKMSGTLDVANVLWPVGKHIFDFPNLDLSNSSDTKFDGAADYDMDRSMADEITVVVEDIQPNGNLVVLGSRMRDIAGDVQVIQISGLVRPSDIAFDNTVKSSRVANFRIVHKMIGRENRFTKPGWLSRIFNIINPF